MITQWRQEVRVEEAFPSGGRFSAQIEREESVEGAVGRAMHW